MRAAPGLIFPTPEGALASVNKLTEARMQSKDFYLNEALRDGVMTGDLADVSKEDLYRENEVLGTRALQVRACVAHLAPSLLVPSAWILTPPMRRKSADILCRAACSTPAVGV